MPVVSRLACRGPYASAEVSHGPARPVDERHSVAAARDPNIAGPDSSAAGGAFTLRCLDFQSSLVGAMVMPDFVPLSELGRVVAVRGGVVDVVFAGALPPINEALRIGADGPDTLIAEVQSHLD